MVSSQSWSFLGALDARGHDLEKGTYSVLERVCLPLISRKYSYMTLKGTCGGAAV